MAEETTIEADPIRALHDADRDAIMQGLEQLQGDPDDAETLNGTALRGGEDEAGKDAETATTARPGTDLQSILATLSDESQQDAVRRIFAENTRLQQEKSGQDDRLADAVRVAVETAMREQRAEDAGMDPDDPLAQVTPEQRSLFERLFEQIAADKGYVKNADLRANDDATYVTEQNTKALEVYGDALGVMVDGEIVLTPEAKAAMSPIYQSLLVDGKAPPRLNYLMLAKAAGLEAPAKGPSKERLNALAKARTETPGSTAAPQARIRGERGTPSDNSQKVMARAFSLAKQQIARR